MMSGTSAIRGTAYSALMKGSQMYSTIRPLRDGDADRDTEDDGQRHANDEWPQALDQRLA
jgi:hypothetical protein